MPVFVCNHCGEVVKNNGGSCREIGMFEVVVEKQEMVGKDGNIVTLVLYYHTDCAKVIVSELLEEI